MGIALASQLPGDRAWQPASPSLLQLGQALWGNRIKGQFCGAPRCLAPWATPGDPSHRLVGYALNLDGDG
ncbi:hypothetical protein IQ254_17850 [Nodosilinea sp. LEGE 07088]|uniref:hypothetical protein n=1 Tax=Nodosilinea sp. LEGE 07088 TaxID=2777968 RepID=UPI00187EA643|nr:hypothetical protein [Nodosilinea sp. LEGE 07088]MBE9139034.1 hypothetical protein [Nodosilinea sp. LEGE 07088]